MGGQRWCLCCDQEVANCSRSGRGTVWRAASLVALRMTGGATPAWAASSQRAAQRHQRSPGWRPGNPYSGSGVERSLPRDLLKARKAAVISAQTVWLPWSWASVRQHPSRKNPVMGSVLHGRSGPP